MFGTGIDLHIKESIPELEALSITLGGRVFNMGDYDRINSLLLHNNILNESKQNIAIIHPKDDLLDVLMIVIMGIAAYKHSINANSKLRIHDFNPGELIEFQGSIVKFMGTLSEHGVEKFKIAYKDKYNTTEDLPLHLFAGVSKYLGAKIEPDPDPASGKKRRGAIATDVVGEILGMQRDSIGLGGYPSFLVASENPKLANLLRGVEINGTPFFQIFPCIRHTPASSHMLGGRDVQQRDPLFHFAASLATADDVLASEPRIKTVLFDANGRPINALSLIEAIRYDYGVEDIYLLQTYEKMSDLEKLDQSLGFKVWFWDIPDFQEFKSSERYAPRQFFENGPERETAEFLERHNNLCKNMSNCSEEVIPVSYPNGFTKQDHFKITAALKHISQATDNESASTFWIRAQAIANKLFQSPANMRIRTDFGEDVEAELKTLGVELKNQIGMDVPAFNTASELLRNLESAAMKFANHSSKLDLIEELLEQNRGKKILIQARSAWDHEFLSMELVNRTGRVFSNVEVAHSPSYSFGAWDMVIWTYRPALDRCGLLSIGTCKNILCLYELQEEEYQLSSNWNRRQIEKYTSPANRAVALGIPQEMLGPVQTTIEEHAEKPVDLDKIFFMASLQLKEQQLARQEASAEALPATRVVFTDGAVAYFQKRHRIKILDTSNQEIRTETVGNLVDGEQVVFLRNSKRTVFEEMVSFFQHKPEVTEQIRKAALWREALVDFCALKNLSVQNLKQLLKERGLNRSEQTVESWLEGNIICPVGDDYAPLDIIASITGSTVLKENIDSVKAAAKSIRALHINIGRYLANKITRSKTPEGLIDDPVLRDKLDDLSSHIEIEEIADVATEPVLINSKYTDRLLRSADLEERIPSWQE